MEENFYLPNAIIVGAQKAGTTTLFNLISQHRDVFGPPHMKDFPFFINEEKFNRGLNWFSKQFEKPNKKVYLHGNVNYLYLHNISAKRIKQFIPNAKIIISLRNPVTRAYSAYWYAVKIGMETKTFEEALHLENQRKNKGSWGERMLLTYIDHGFYSNQVQAYLNVFGKENVQVLIFEEWVKNPIEHIRKIYEFLNIDNSFLPNLVKENTSGIPRIRILQRFLSSLYLPRPLKKIIPQPLKFKIRNKLLKLNIKSFKYPKMEQHVEEYLYSLYKEDIEKLENILGRDLSIWKK